MTPTEQIEKDSAEGIYLLVESLAHSMALAMQSEKGERLKPGPKRQGITAPTKIKRGRPTVAGLLYTPRETRSIIRLAIEDVERTHPGWRIVLLDKDTLTLAEEIRDYLPEARDAKSQERIAKWIDALVESSDPLAEPRQKIDKANAELRVKFMRAFETFTSREIAEHANRQNTVNPHMLASRWKTDDKIFAIDWQGQKRFPAFQFDQGKPKQLIGKVLNIFKGSLGPWETAFWFVSSNKWLDGKAPIDVIADEDGVIRAAYSTTCEYFG